MAITKNVYQVVKELDNKIIKVSELQGLGLSMYSIINGSKRIRFTTQRSTTGIKDPSSGSDSDSEISLIGTPVDPIPPSSEEPLYISSDPEEDPYECSEISIVLRIARPDKSSDMVKRNRDEASFWWESSKALLEGKDLSWEKFTEMILEKFVLEYVNTDAKKAKRFQQGLRPLIRSQVALLEIKNYAALVQKAMIVEGEREAAKRENKGQNQKFQKFKPGNGAQKNHFQKTGLTGKDSRPQIQECKVCAKRHSERCNKLDVTSFKCNQKGHYSSECSSGSKKPKLTCFKCGKVGYMVRNFKEPVQKVNVLRIAGLPLLPAPIAQPRARTFNMTMKDAMQDMDVVAGMLVINSVEVKVLMDSRATRSFIAESILDRLKCVAYPLEPNLITELANKEKVIVNRVYLDCDVVIEGRYFSADLIPFKLGEFDVILGTDWLSNHEAQIECKSKKVKLKTKDGIEVIFKGKRQEEKFLTAIQMRRLLHQGCEAYLAHVKDIEKESVRIEDISVVRDFPDVFPDELPGLPPDREIEFTIDLAPGMEPISKAPYRMAPVEMKELATQLQELLDKGLIRPSISP
ncbi:hypothetical protein AgCh_005864 [Apium graveolens]